MKFLNHLKKSLKYAGYFIFQNPPIFEKPTALQFPVNDICNSKCRMCNIWTKSKTKEVSSSEIKTTLKDDAFSELTTVGLSGGEPTLREDLKDLVESILLSSKKIKDISIISNGQNYQQVKKRLFEVAEVCKKFNVSFHVMFSVDGIYGQHDHIRRSPGNFDSIVKITDYVKSQPNLFKSISYSTTVITQNIAYLWDILSYSQKKNIHIKYRLGIEHDRLYNSTVLNAFSLKDEQKYELGEFLNHLIINYEKNDGQKLIYKNIKDMILNNKPRQIGCLWQHRGLTLFSDGSLGFCAVKSPKILRSNESNNIWRDIKANKKILKNIINNHCKNCAHDYTSIPNRKQIINKILKFDVFK